MRIGNKIGIAFQQKINWSSYWATRYISALSVVTTSPTEQTITGTMVGTGQTGISFEFSTDRINWTVKGTSVNGVFLATGLTSGTNYYWRARLYRGSNYGSYFATIPNAYTYAVDPDGNVYTPVIVGQQVWMVQNLKTTKYNDGSAITRVTGNAAWAALTTEAYDWYSGDIANKAAYGGLYNGYSVDSGKLAPTTLKIPTKEDFDRLNTFAGGISVAGGKLKEVGTDHWNNPNVGALDTYGFAARGNGYRKNTDGTFVSNKQFAYHFSKTAGATGLYAFGMRDNTDDSIGPTDFDKKFGFAIRCMRDSFYGTAVQFYGDSVTKGTFASDNAHRWTSLWCALRGLTETNNGTNGQCLQNTVPTNPTGPTNFRDSVAAISATLYLTNQLVLAFGTNDVGLNLAGYTVAQFKADYAEVLDALNTKGWYRKNIVLVSPYYSTQIGRDAYTAYGVVTPADEQRLADHVTAVSELAVTYGCQFVDVYTYMKNNGGASLLNADGIHPNDAGHAAIASYINSVIV